MWLAASDRCYVYAMKCCHKLYSLHGKTGTFRGKHDSFLPSAYYLDIWWGVWVHFNGIIPVFAITGPMCMGIQVSQHSSSVRGYDLNPQQHYTWPKSLSPCSTILQPASLSTLSALGDQDIVFGSDSEKLLKILIFLVLLCAHYILSL